MAYFDLTSNQGYLANYKVGLTGETGVVITPAVKATIQNTVDAYINGKFKRTFTTVPPMITEIAAELSMWQIISRVAPGRDPSGMHDREAAWAYKEKADALIRDVMMGGLDLYQTDGSKISISTKEGKYVKHGEDAESHVFKMESTPENWGKRSEVYDG